MDNKEVQNQYEKIQPKDIHESLGGVGILS